MESLTDSSRIWTQVTSTISYNNNRYNKHAFQSAKTMKISIIYFNCWDRYVTRVSEKFCNILVVRKAQFKKFQIFLPKS